MAWFSMDFRRCCALHISNIMSKTGLYSILNVDETTTPAELLDKYRHAGEMRIALDDVEFREREKVVIVFERL